MITKRIIGLLALLFSFNLFAQNIFSDYYEIVSMNDYYSATKQKKYIVVPCDVKSDDLTGHEKNSDYIISWAFYLCEIERNRKLLQYIQELTNSKNDKDSIADLLTSIYYFAKDNYNAAILSFNKYNGCKFKFLKFLLIADSKYELLDDKFNWPDILPDYQTAYDYAQRNEYKKLIKERIKCVRYRR